MGLLDEALGPVDTASAQYLAWPAAVARDCTEAAVEFFEELFFVGAGGYKEAGNRAQRIGHSRWFLARCALILTYFQGDRTCKLLSSTTPEAGRYVESLGEPVTGEASAFRRGPSSEPTSDEGSALHRWETTHTANTAEKLASGPYTQGQILFASIFG